MSHRNGSRAVVISSITSSHGSSPRTTARSAVARSSAPTYRDCPERTVTRKRCPVSYDVKTAPPDGSVKKYVPVNGVSVRSAARTRRPSPLPEIRSVPGEVKTAWIRDSPLRHVSTAGSATISVGRDGTSDSTACMPLRCETTCTSCAYLASPTTGERPNHAPERLNGISRTENSVATGVSFQSLTAPEVTPAATKRWATTMSTVAGTDATTAVAMIEFHSWLLLPM